MAGSCRALSFLPLSGSPGPADPRSWLLSGRNARHRRSHPSPTGGRTMLTQILLAALVVTGSAATFREVLRGRPRRIGTRRGYDTRTPSLR
ncbi:hypothetical protein Ae168Ps1_0585 [Pseudonocardia sp. Ae168_Ps1]|nr:hypothetical protein Ae168Ps1_0585 [Pseudonocardia sp. Ae168_Ps1]OLL87699.1 hypothetical protein Ae263Ps1_4754c [Pseudonocardia sp. Ae263_Ps1]OLL92274.1 hypothetical protein Ae356Ps1_2171 [Pseudonocardia sp. Ae356_Ps1]